MIHKFTPKIDDKELSYLYVPAREIHDKQSLGDALDRVEPESRASYDK